MTTISIEVDDEVIRRLEEQAGVVEMKLNEWIIFLLRRAASQPNPAVVGPITLATEEEFNRAAEYVLVKNAELMRRLA